MEEKHLQEETAAADPEAIGRAGVAEPSGPPPSKDPLGISNLFGQPPPPEDLTVYPDADTHLRDELWRVWLRVELEIRMSWELGALPETHHEGGLGAWGASDIAGLFRAAHATFSGQTVQGRELGAKTLLDAYLRHSAALERRVERTLRAGLRLPLLEVVRRFGLGPRQRACLTFTLMPELDPRLLTAYRYLTHDPGFRQVDGRLLALLVYDSPASRAQLAHDLSPDAPLIFYRLLEMDDSLQRHDSPLFRRLRPAARLVPLLTAGLAGLDPRLRDVAVIPAAAPAGLFPETTLATVMAALASDRDVLIALQGQRGTGKRLLLQTAASQLDRRVLFLQAAALAGRPLDAARLLVRSLLREALLFDAIPVVCDLDDIPLAGGQRLEAPAFLAMLCEDHRGPVAITVAGEHLPRCDFRPLVQVTLGIPSLPERCQLWQREVEGLPDAGALALSERFAVPGGIIALAARAAQATARIAVGDPSGHPGDPIDVQALDRAVRSQLHNRLGRLGRKLDTPYTFDDLIVDEDTLMVLSEILACVKERRQVRERWGLRGPPGVSVLFSGEPGVGKTMSAMVLARTLDLELYEMDLSQVTSKWVGETEKNLAEIFDAAEPGHMVILFNEADSLFGRRTTDVKSANDRYANLETNYLLQRLERFGGLAILTTNLGKAIDPAFRRRFAYDVQFGFPTSEMRAELWRRALPRAAAASDIDYQVLGRQFELSGGFIKVAAERAAFVAAALGELIDAEILGSTIERMYRERGKLVPIGKLE